MVDIVDWSYLEQRCRKKYNLSDSWRLSAVDNSDSEYLIMIFRRNGTDGMDSTFHAYLSNQEVLKWQLLKLKEEVEGLKGLTVNTLWGPSTILGVFKNEEDGELYVHLKEFGTEDYYYCIKLQWWKEILQ
mgnify:FL=1